MARTRQTTKAADDTPAADKTPEEKVEAATTPDPAPDETAKDEAAAPVDESVDPGAQGADDTDEAKAAEDEAAAKAAEDEVDPESTETDDETESGEKTGAERAAETNPVTALDSDVSVTDTTGLTQRVDQPKADAEPGRVTRSYNPSRLLAGTTGVYDTTGLAGTPVKALPRDEDED